MCGLRPVRLWFEWRQDGPSICMRFVATVKQRHQFQFFVVPGPSLCVLGAWTAPV